MRKNYSGYSRRRKSNFFEKLSATNVLIAINVLAFVSFWIFSIIAVRYGISLDDLVKYVAINPALFFKGYVWTLLTSMFMHGSFTHLFVNMLSMFFIGNFLERVIGRKRFLGIYFISGLLAGLFFVLLAYFGIYVPLGDRIFGSTTDFAVGASGALFGLGGLLAVLIPRLKVLVFFVIPMPMWAAMTALIFGLWIFSIAGGLPVGNTAHFGGLVAGVVYGFYLRSKYKRKIKMLNRVFV